MKPCTKRQLTAFAVTLLTLNLSVAEAAQAGATGPVGRRGPAGPQVLKGVTGNAGVARLAGPQGIKGDIGPQGMKGDSGADSTVPGPQGVVGPRGSAGLPQAGNDVGDMQYWDGSTWVIIPAPKPVVRDKTIATLQFCNGVPGWDAAINCVYTPNTDPNNHTPYHIGDNGPAGGVIFYVTDGTGLHGLEVAPVDQSSFAVWGCYGFSISGAYGTAVGTGAANTAAIVARCPEPYTAAKIADAYALNGYTDWYLPSKNELNLLYQQKIVVGGFASSSYWSSSELDSENAWVQLFGKLFQSFSGKYSPLPVRAVRAF